MTSSALQVPDELDLGYAGRRDPGRATKQLTIHGRELGRRLRQAQAAAGMDGVALANALGVSPSTLSKIMNGSFVPTATEAAALLALCKVNGKARDRILDLCHPRHDTGILRLTDGAQWDALLFYTGEAAQLIEYEPLMIPWLVQTEDYITALLSPPDGKEDHPVTTSMDKPSVKTRAALRNLRPRLAWVELIVHEWALRAPIGTPLVRLVQLRQLLRMSELAKVSLRVIPARYSLPVTALSGFTILEFDDKPSLLFREDPTGGVFCDDAVQVASHRRLAGHLSSIALDFHSSRALIEEIAEENTRASGALSD